MLLPHCDYCKKLLDDTDMSVQNFVDAPPLSAQPRFIVEVSLPDTTKAQLCRQHRLEVLKLYWDVQRVKP